MGKEDKRLPEASQELSPEGDYNVFWINHQCIQ